MAPDPILLGLRGITFPAACDGATVTFPLAAGLRVGGSVSPLPAAHPGIAGPGPFPCAARSAPPPLRIPAHAAAAAPAAPPDPAPCHTRSLALRWPRHARLSSSAPTRR